MNFTKSFPGICTAVSWPSIVVLLRVPKNIILKKVWNCDPGDLTRGYSIENLPHQYDAKNDK